MDKITITVEGGALAVAVTRMDRIRAGGMLAAAAHQLAASGPDTVLDSAEGGSHAETAMAGPVRWESMDQIVAIQQQLVVRQRAGQDGWQLVGVLPTVVQESVPKMDEKGQLQVIQGPPQQGLLLMFSRPARGPRPDETAEAEAGHESNGSARRILTA